jgi:hypothetical protein
MGQQGKRKVGLIAIAALLIAGCSSAQTLRNGQDVAPFVKSVATGAGARWHLAADASPQAKHTWQNKGPTEMIGYELRSGQAWWGCRTLALLNAGHGKFQVAGVAERDGAGGPIVNEVIEKADLLTSAERGDIVDAVCPTR